MNKVKGMYDVLPEESYKWHYIEKKIHEITKKYDFKQIRTPIVEHSEVFHRDNEFSDMVTKETYNFLDRSNRNLTLRPEGTSGVVRSYIENKLYVTDKLSKMYYYGSYYRYERPQKGRYREFYQFGVEAIGLTNPSIDAEVISLAYHFIESLNLKNVSVLVNTLGDNESRLNYNDALVKFLEPLKDKLSIDSQKRLTENPLRILDSKNKIDQELLKNAPKVKDYLTKESKDYFKEVLNYLDLINVEYKIDDSLVRGLDYYSNTVFEIEAEIKDFGAQNVLGGGGRYDNLVKELGGPQIEGVGFAFGVDRLLLALEMEDVLPKNNNNLDCYVIYFNEHDQKYAYNILNELRKENLKATTNFESLKFKQQLRDALNKNAKYLVIIGDEEIKNNMITLKNTKTEKQETLTLSDAINKIKGDK